MNDFFGFDFVILLCILIYLLFDFLVKTEDGTVCHHLNKAHVSLCKSTSVHVMVLWKTSLFLYILISKSVLYAMSIKAQQSKFKVDFKFKVGLNSKSG
jgi:hypothetical protein